ncbi:extracellular metal-dependent peptidase [Idiomarina xiamenensis]|uniref:Extracellular metal-dependent peptidase n=1 Tax=Idiomarina xiamenensis 10-D-4 TaxID=740709 RepID=K2J9J3_9GAMM|nr:extracellular metal-dependent peptidase [Idiomarina xiamenensis]EKE79921.1 extracellular metal-dependent peptidase [Idiomarina xiamenensis 10-D-4]
MRNRHSHNLSFTNLASMLVCGVLALLITGSSPLTSNLWSAAYGGDAQAQWQAAQRLLQQRSFSAAYPWALAAAEQGQLDALSLLEQRLPSQYQQWQRWRAQFDSSSAGQQALQQLWQRRLRQSQLTLADLQQLWQQQPSAQPRWLAQLSQLRDYRSQPDFAQQCQWPVVIQLQHRRQLERALQMMQAWRDSPLQRFDVCFAWQQQAQLRCGTEDTRQRAHCLPSVNIPDQEVYRWRFSDHGIASANAQAITLTDTSGAAVLLHEMGHWFGLADEYPMSTKLAQRFCQGDYRHPSLNVVVTRSQRLTALQLEALYRRLPWRHAVADWRQLGQLQADGRWLLGSAAANGKAVGLYPVATCDRVSGYYAWRPVAQTTVMQRQEVAHWPALYLTLMQNYWRSVKDPSD